nr:venom polypeptide precursor [Doratifera vulnerans]
MLRVLLLFVAFSMLAQVFGGRRKMKCKKYVKNSDKCDFSWGVPRRGLTG